MINDPALSSDRTLLQLYAKSQDPEAFTELTKRYAGLVYGTCKRVLGSDDDAQDVSQECFLELARKAGSVRSSLPAYLHLLAKTRSVDAIRRSAARRRNEQEAAMQTTDTPDPTWAEISPLVDEALTHLPERLRVPVILHYLQGQTQSQIAAQLGVNQSSISRSLEKGIAALRESLKKAGVMVTVGSLTALLTKNAATAAPAALISSLGKIAISGVGVGSIGLASLTGSVAGKCALGLLIVGVLLAARPLYLPHKETEVAVAAVQPKGIITTDLATILRGCKKTAASITSAKGKMTYIEDVKFSSGNSSHCIVEYDLAYRGNEIMYQEEMQSSRDQVTGLKAILGQGRPKMTTVAFNGRTAAIMSEERGNRVGDTTTQLGEEEALYFALNFDIGNYKSDRTGIRDLEAYYAYITAAIQQSRAKFGESPITFSPLKVVGQETVRGDKCAIIEYKSERDGKVGSRVRFTNRFWINTAKGFTLARSRSWIEGGRLGKRVLIYTAEHTVRCYPGGVWGPVKSESVRYDYDLSYPSGTKPPDVWRDTMIYDPDFQLNVPVTDAELTFAFPKGTWVTNEVTKTNFQVR